jgi:hypothetical protein
VLIAFDLLSSGAVFGLSLDTFSGLTSARNNEHPHDFRGISIKPLVRARQGAEHQTESKESEGAATGFEASQGGE